MLKSHTEAYAWDFFSQNPFKLPGLEADGLWTQEEEEEKEMLTFWVFLLKTEGAVGGCWTSCISPPVAQAFAAPPCISLPDVSAAAAGSCLSPA